MWTELFIWSEISSWSFLEIGKWGQEARRINFQRKFSKDFLGQGHPVYRFALSYRFSLSPFLSISYNFSDGIRLLDGASCLDDQLIYFHPLISFPNFDLCVIGVYSKKIYVYPCFLIEHGRSVVAMVLHIPNFVRALRKELVYVRGIVLKESDFGKPDQAAALGN